MNGLIGKNSIETMVCGANFAYILQDNSAFLSTEYKVLQSQSNSCFIKCMKMLYNGRVQLYYLTNQYKSLAAMLAGLDAESFMNICANLFADIIEVKSNGFLSCCSIDISLDRIYIDPTTYKVRLVYLPFSPGMFEDTASFENELRTSLIKLIQSMPNLAAQKTELFAANLSNGLLSLENLYSSIKRGNLPRQPDYADQVVQTEAGGRMKLVAMNAPTRVEIEITKNEFVIGKKPELVDGVVSFNKMISRSHCKIVKNGTQYLIADLQSANGTFVNHVRLQPNQMHPIKGGDVIRLANSDFQVVME